MVVLGVLGVLNQGTFTPCMNVTASRDLGTIRVATKCNSRHTGQLTRMEKGVKSPNQAENAAILSNLTQLGTFGLIRITTKRYPYRGFIGA
jgi:hypothetical protein